MCLTSLSVCIKGSEIIFVFYVFCVFQEFIFFYGVIYPPKKKPKTRRLVPKTGLLVNWRPIGPVVSNITNSTIGEYLDLTPKTYFFKNSLTSLS